jgi:hypothetical protein
MFKNSKVGDKVWDFKYGCGEVKKVSKNGYPFPINIVFYNWPGSFWFNYDGKDEKGANQTLFFLPFEPPKEACTPPKRKVKKWKWLYIHIVRNEVFITDGRYATKQDVFNSYNMVKDVLYKIPESEVEVEID